MEAVLAGIKVITTEDGYLNDFSQWTKEIGLDIAASEGIEMTEKHWEVIQWIQDQVQAKKPLSIRGIKKKWSCRYQTILCIIPKRTFKNFNKNSGCTKT